MEPKDSATDGDAVRDRVARRDRAGLGGSYASYRSLLDDIPEEWRACSEEIEGEITGKVEG